MRVAEQTFLPRKRSASAPLFVLLERPSSTNRLIPPPALARGDCHQVADAWLVVMRRGSLRAAEEITGQKDETISVWRVSRGHTHVFGEPSIAGSARSRRVTVVPLPGTLLMEMVPPCASINSFAIERPRPLPLTRCARRLRAGSAR